MLKVGDVVKGKPTFVFGRTVSVGDEKYVEGVSKVQVDDRSTEPYRVMVVKNYDRKTGEANYVNSKKYALVDKTRASAEFVVESVKMTGGSEQAGYPDEPHIVARRLNKDGSYNPNGELITFVDAPTGRSCYITAVQIEAVRHMTRTVNFA